MASAKIRAVGTNNNSQPAIRRLFEDAAETFLSHTPVALDSDGYVIAWDGATLDAAQGSIIGVALEPGSNLTTEATPETLTFGSVPHQSAAVKIPRGAPPNDGKVGVLLARTETRFRAQINPSGQSLLQSDIGVNYGMTIDSDGHWYVDKSKTGASAVCTILGRDPNEDGLADSARRACFIRFMDSRCQQL